MKNLFSFNFEIHSLVRDILKNWWVYILAFLIGFMGCSVYNGYTYSPTYTSRTVLCVNRSTGGATTYANVKYSKQLTSVFAEVFVQRAMQTKAANSLGMYSFSGSVSASVVENTNFLSLSVTSSTPDTAYKMLHAILDVYPEITEKLLLDSVITVIQPPNMPTRPSSPPDNSDSIKIGAIAAAAIVAVIAVLSIFRATVKNETSFNNLVDGKLFGTIVHERKQDRLVNFFKKKKSSLLIYNNYNVSLNFVESFQKIATKIEYMRRKNDDRVFLITSVAENEGKSTSASNIAIALASRGNRVLLFDFDLKRPALYKIFDVSKEKVANTELSEMMSGKVDFSNYMFCRFRKSSLYMALNTKASSSYHPWMEKENVKKVIEHFRERFDFIIIDTAPISVDSSITNVIPIADKVILLSRTDVVFASDVNDAIMTINDVGGELCGCVLNDVYPEFSLFGQSGYDETGYYTKRYSKKNYEYSPYNRYGRYSETLGLFDDKNIE